MNAESLDRYADDWQRNAEADPLWVILADPKFYGRKWDPGEFFATGDEEIARVFGFMKEEKIAVPMGTFMDFGCGVGRVSKALRKRFAFGYGVDIAPKMIELARTYVDGVDFIINQSDSLSQFNDNSIDFVYSHIVLQHIPSHYQVKYIRELLRVLKPGGLAAIQIPIDLVNGMEIKPGGLYHLKKTMGRWFPWLLPLSKRLGGKSDSNPGIRIEMHILSQEVMQTICKNGACVIERSIATNSCDTDHDGRLEFYELVEHRRKMEDMGKANLFLSCMYFVRKLHAN